MDVHGWNDEDNGAPDERECLLLREPGPHSPADFQPVGELFFSLFFSQAVVGMIAALTNEYAWR